MSEASVMHRKSLFVLLAAVKVKGKKVNVCTLKSGVITITLQYSEILEHTTYSMGRPTYKGGLKSSRPNNKKKK
jgi:hypothetical protein